MKRRNQESPLWRLYFAVQLSEGQQPTPSSSMVATLLMASWTERQTVLSDAGRKRCDQSNLLETPTNAAVSS
jgi:hypothetical protein